MRELEDPEMVSTPFDRHKRLPRESLARSNDGPPKQPALWAINRHWSGEQLDPEPCYGRYPKGFLEWAIDQAQLRGRTFLHVCSGGMKRSDSLGGIRVDLRSQARPDILGDGTRLPFLDNSVHGVLLDPPYSVEYAESLYGVKYPRPSHLLREALRVTKPGGRFAILHYLVPVPPKGANLTAVHAVTQGLGYRIRAWSLFTKLQGELFAEPRP